MQLRTLKLNFVGGSKSAALIQHMWEQEKEHKKIFDKLMVKYRVRPTALMPFWNIAGFMLGAGNEKKIAHLIKILISPINNRQRSAR